MCDPRILYPAKVLRRHHDMTSVHSGWCVEHGLWEAMGNGFLYDSAEDLTYFPRHMITSLIWSPTISSFHWVTTLPPHSAPGTLVSLALHTLSTFLP